MFLSEIRVLGEKAVEIDPNNVIQNISYTTSLSESDFVSGYTDLDRTKLSDGIIGDRVTWKNSKSVGMNLPSAGEIPISFAFGELKTVRQINFSVYQERNKNIFFPSSVLIEYQDAGDQWQEWCNAYIPPSNSSYCELVCIAPENIMAKGVRFSFVLDKGSLFMDEIQVLSQVDGKTDNMTGNDPPKPPATDENNLICGVKYVTNLKDGDANAGLGDFSGEGDLTRSKLTDGIKAPYGTNWSDKAFLLMHWATGVEDKRVHISFDFGGAKTFQQINIGTFGGASGIYIPEKALIEYQNENGTWQSLYDGQLPTSNVEMFKQLVYVVPNNGSITAKGIRFAFTIAGSWMCVDEMEVLNQADGSIPNINPPTGASEKPTLTTDLPTSKSVQTNKAVTLTVEATVSDGGTLSYQWYKGSQKIGTNSNIYTIANAASGDSGNYRVVVTNTLAGKYNTAESTNCYLTVSGEEPPKPAETNLLSGISYVTSFQDGDANLGMGDFHGDHPDSNRTRLTDGIMAAAWGDPATVGYNLKSAEKPLDLQFSLGKATKFQEIQLGAFGGDSGITTPSSMKIEVKNGDGNWHLIFDGKTPGKAPGTRYVFTSVYEQDITATDIRFTIDSTESWVFLDEVQLFSKTTGTTSFADLEMDYKPMENNLVAGKAYEVSAEASPSYPDSGHKELTDGKYGAANYSNGEWVGFIDYTGVTPVDIIFDLGSVKTFEEVKFNNLCSKNVGIKLLKGAQIFVSDDQQNWKQVLDYAITPTTSSLMIYNFKYTAYHSIQARYVKLAIGMSGWGFIDEVEILAQSEDNLGDNSNNIALHKKYSSTPKADPAYADTSSLSKLTDGRMSVADFSQLAWVGYSKSGENTEIIVDLEEETSFEQVGIHFLNDGNNQILLPANVDVTYSLDQSSWTSFASSSIQPISSEEPVVYQYQATIPNGTAAAKGRYVKFSFPTSEKVFLNEIQIFKNKTISNDGESADPLPTDPNNLANGCSYTTSWAAETSHSDDGKLTNGTRANPSHLDRQWVGYQTKEPNAGSAFDITVDLGSVKSFEQVKIGFLEAIAQEFNVNIPAEITVQYSNNQSAWSSYQARTALSRKEGYTVLRFCTEAAKPVSARYVRFTLLLKATAFIDEIEILEKFVQGEDASTNPDNGETVNLVRGSDKVGASRPADFRNSAEVLTDGLYGITGT
ncbi:MAG: discoidin domain-containing protein, partial [Oscillospiraceae bacterium]